MTGVSRWEERSGNEETGWEYTLIYLRYIEIDSFLAAHIDFLKIIAYNKGTDMNLLRVNA